MKFSRHWLETTLEQSLEKSILLEKLTMAGLEVESCEPVAKPFSKVLVGYIARCEPHPDAKKLQITYINIGEADLLQIVCGGKNARAGIKVAVAVCGAVLNDDFHIKPTSLRGVESMGMCCSETELGLADSSDGIIELPADAPIGECVREYLKLDDEMITLGITPNRGDCLSIKGIAQDTAAIFGFDYISKNIPNVSAVTDVDVPIQIDNLSGCPHYVGRVIRNINLNVTTPIWLQERLRRSGIRSIDPVVDVTNYVMLELGQPMHAFDYDQIHGGIIVRDASDKEKLTLLNGDEVTLNPKYLMIADHQRPLAIAGIMGGEASSVSADTQHIFLESAFFSPAQIANRARWLGLNTDSSYRFERGVDPNLQVIAIERATQLLLNIVGGEPGIVQSVPDQYTVLPRHVDLPKQQLQRLIGVELNSGAVKNLLQRLEIHCLTETETTWTFNIPTRRSDIAIAEDLIEEVARIYGYDKIPATIPELPLNIQQQSESNINMNMHKKRLCDLGYQEVITYSFVDSKLQQQLEPSLAEQQLMLKNPIAADLNAMRVSLLPGLVKTALYNQCRQQTRGQLFEIAMCFQQSSHSKLQQTQRLAGIRWGSKRPQQWSEAKQECDFFTIKGDVEAILKQTFCSSDFDFIISKHPSFHPGQAADIKHEGKFIGLIGQLHPKLQIELDVTHSLFYFELDLDAVSSIKLPMYEELSKFPSIRRDLAIVVEKHVSAEQLLANIRQVAGDILVSVHVFDVYSDEKMGSQQSVAMSLLLQDKTKTLVDTEINTLMENVLHSLNQQFKAVLRE